MAEIIRRDEDGNTLRRLASGTLVCCFDDGTVDFLCDEDGNPIDRDTDDEDYGEWEGPTCGICDALGHDAAGHMRIAEYRYADRCDSWTNGHVYA